jgi:NDP-sugar pyrophosphorylase family protein
VAHVLERLQQGGVADAVLNLHHLPATITSRIGDGAALGVRVRYSWETTVLGSAGGPARAAPIVGKSPFLVVNGDTLAQVDLPALTEAHVQSGALVTLAVAPNRDPQKYRGVAVDENGAVTGFVEKGDARPSWHFVGVQVVDRRALDGVSVSTPSETTRALYPALLAAAPGSIRAVAASGPFFDIGTPADYLATCRTFARANAYSGAGVVDSVLWDDVVVEPGASLTRCIVTDGVRIPAGASWTDRTIRLATGGPLEPTETRVGELAVGPIEPHVTQVVGVR